MNMKISGDARLLAHDPVLPSRDRLIKTADFCVDRGLMGRGLERQIGGFSGYGFSDF
jgi:hypothetical protein